MSKNKAFILIFHVVCWIIVAIPSVMFVPHHIQQDTVMYMLRLGFPMLMCVMFYLNYLWLVPHYLINHKINIFLLVNVVFTVLFAFLMQHITDTMHAMEVNAGLIPHKHPHIPFMMLMVGFIMKNVVPLLMNTAVAILLRLALRWQKAEAARREMEIQKTEAELKNLRNQINPHFLLNTLNNIYALIAFDRDKAQSAVLSLSAMLRQMLYGTQKNSVSLKDEAEFLRNYVDLMRIRQGKNVTVTMDVSIAEHANVYVAPFIFISLVENAFKHGVSTTEPSSIYVKIASDGEKIECEIKNTNFPKSDSDKSGHGIGLTQVQKRLELAYKDKYEWIKGTDEKKEFYYSKITIYDTELRNN